ncbi:sensor of ECF-type sigma factor [Flavobacterium silvisoli]|uniref:Sensor of ECF-type sigma factor n=1 Tax=Flavobacterium silvisoli TaxID=2529433 RepID=A0A4Q9YSQ1_9FLAO|nr:sensor of ECF-type sigma factor [Flavobacterium silvisoli]TBX66642.1 sensor of ECF-type sigma factor [Flavobacterium silvisoli]
MKINKILALLTVLISINAVAQNGRLREKREQIKALKVAFITDELALTPDEAAKFWPLFNAFEDKQQEIKKQKLKAYINRMDDDSFYKLTEKDASAMLNQMEAMEDDLYQAKKKFINSLKGVISPIKILKLKKAEENFNRKLLQQYRDKKLGR